jgi:hypothetical protein
MVLYATSTSTSTALISSSRSSVCCFTAATTTCFHLSIHCSQVMAEDTKVEAAPVLVPLKNYGFPPEAFDWTKLPNVNENFLPPQDLEAFVQALSAPDPLQSREDLSTYSSASLLSPGLRSSSSLDVTKRYSTVGPASGGGDGSPEDAQAVAAHAAAVSAEVVPPSPSASGNFLRTPAGLHRQGSGLSQTSATFITAQNDWAPVNQKVVRHHSTSSTANKRRRRAEARKQSSEAAALIGTRSKDETREGYLYTLLKWPFLLFVGGWIVSLGAMYLITRLYIWLYEHFVAWRGTRDRLRRAMRATANYPDWVQAARELDAFLGNQRWKEENHFAYYDSKTVKSVAEQMKRCRLKAEAAEVADNRRRNAGNGNVKAVADLRALVEACVKNNFVGVENPRLYSQTYYGTKNLVQNFVDEGPSSRSLSICVWRFRLAIIIPSHHVYN